MELCPLYMKPLQTDNGSSVYTLFFSLLFPPFCKIIIVSVKGLIKAWCVYYDGCCQRCTCVKDLGSSLPKKQRGNPLHNVCKFGHWNLHMHKKTHTTLKLYFSLGVIFFFLFNFDVSL